MNAPFIYPAALVSRATATSNAIQGAPVTIASVLDGIKSGVWADRIAQLRAALASAGNSAPQLEAAKILKRNLPAVIFGGTFSARSKAGLLIRSGVLVIDLDDLADPGATRAALANDPHVCSAFISPSMTGLKVLVAVPTDIEQGRCFKAAEARFLTVHGLTADPSGKDVSRLCYVSHDADAYLADPTTVQILPVPDIAPTAPLTTVAAPETTATSPEIIVIARAYVASLPPAVSGQSGHQATFRAALALAWGFGLSNVDALPLFQEYNARCVPPWETSDLEHKLDGAREPFDGKPPFKWLVPSGKTLIELPGGDISITQAADQIFGLIGEAKSLFFRGGRVHEVSTDGDGTRRLGIISPAQFRSRIEAYGRVCAWRSGANGEKVLKPTLCPEETARALLEALPARERLPNIEAIAAAPVFADGGDDMHILGPGWHPHMGGLFVTGGETPPLVPFGEAVASLAGLLMDFDFADGGDRSRAIASILAPALRFGGWLKNPLPIDLGEADASQSGKTYRQKVVAAIYRERCNVITQRTGGVGGLDESLAQKLIDGRPFILIDNVRGKIDSPYLEAILTAPGPMPARIPHKGEVQVDPRAFVFQVTSNGAETTKDLANRSSIIRIRKRPAGYAFRLFPEGDLHSHVVANQPYYLGCVFAVVMEWANRGSPRTNEGRHAFREWAQRLDWIVQNLFETPPLLDGHEAARDRIGDPRRGWLRSLCLAMRDNPENIVGTEFGAIGLGEFAVSRDIPPPAIRADADEMALAKKIGVIMASQFGTSDDIMVDGFKIIRARRYSVTQMRETYVYLFPKDPTGGLN